MSFISPQDIKQACIAAMGPNPNAGQIGDYQSTVDDQFDQKLREKIETETQSRINNSINSANQLSSATDTTNFPTQNFGVQAPSIPTPPSFSPQVPGIPSVPSLPNGSLPQIQNLIPQPNVPFGFIVKPLLDKVAKKAASPIQKKLNQLVNKTQDVASKATSTVTAKAQNVQESAENRALGGYQSALGSSMKDLRRQSKVWTDDTQNAKRNAGVYFRVNLGTATPDDVATYNQVFTQTG